MNEQPTLTVLMTVRNEERHLRESIDSLLGQRYGDFELLVVDDASTDGTAAILDSYDDTRLVVLRNPENLGVCASTNRGLEQCGGRYVARQDGDDVSEPERLARQVAFLDENASAVLVASAYRRIDDDGRVIGTRQVPLDPVSIRWRLLFLNSFAHSSVTFRKEVVARVGGYRAEFAYGHDYDLWSRLAREGPLAALPEPLARYRTSRDSITSTVGREVDDVERISRDNVRRLGGPAEELAASFDHEAAWRLLFAGAGRLDPERARHTAREVLAIEKAFARRERLAGLSRVRHRGAVRLQLARAVRTAGRA